MKNNRTILIIGILCAALLAAAVMRLFLLRFQSGDVYPAYSSLRADPLGTRVLYESLAQCEGITVARSFEEPHRLTLTPDTTLLYLGDTLSEYDMLPGDFAGNLNSFIRKGGRVVITVFPRNYKPSDDEDEAATDEINEEDSPVDEKNIPHADDKDQDLEEPEDGTEDEDEASGMINALDWLIAGIDDEPIESSCVATLSTNRTASGLPPTLSCHTSLFFTEWNASADENTNASALPAAWTSIYERNGKPVVIERTLGKGTIVLSALSYFVSNEAMRNERQPELLVWLLGNRPNVIFDEYHHGLNRRTNITMLARRYRLHGVLLGLTFLGMLFIWQSASSLIPRGINQAYAASKAGATGKGSSAGLVNLLRRNIPTTRVLQTCLDQWRQALPHMNGERVVKLAEMQRILDSEKALPLHKRNVTRTYNAMAAIANMRGTPTPPAQIEQPTNTDEPSPSSTGKDLN